MTGKDKQYICPDAVTCGGCDNDEGEQHGIPHEKNDKCNGVPNCPACIPIQEHSEIKEGEKKKPYECLYCGREVNPNNNVCTICHLTNIPPFVTPKEHKGIDGIANQEVKDEGIDGRTKGYIEYALKPMCWCCRLYNYGNDTCKRNYKCEDREKAIQLIQQHYYGELEKLRKDDDIVQVRGYTTRDDIIKDRVFNKAISECQKKIKGE